MFLRFIFIFLFLISFIHPAFAQTPENIGTVIETEGAATITRQGAKIAAAIDAPVYLNDVIDTASQSRLHLLLIDDTQITLGENSQLTLDEYVFDENTSSAKGRFSVLRGTFLFASGLITKLGGTPDVKINTGYGVIGLRGTTVWGGDIDGEYGVFVADGEVLFENDASNATIRAGEGTRIKGRRAAPARPEKWREENINRATQTIALKRADTVRQRIGEKRIRNQEFRAKRREAVKQRLEKMPPQQKQQLHEKIQEKRTERKPGMPEKAERRRDRPAMRQDARPPAPSGTR